MAHGEGRRPRPHPDQDAPHLADNLEAPEPAALLIDLDDRVPGWNSAAERVFQLKAAAPIGRRFRDPEARCRIPHLRALLEEVKRNGNRRAIPDLSFTRPDGTLVVARIALAPVTGAQHRVQAVLVTADECTDHASLRMERDQLAAQLEALVTRHQEVEQELLTTAEELRTANEELAVVNEVLLR